MAETTVQPVQMPQSQQWILLAVVGIGGFLLWQNRDKFAPAVEPVKDLAPKWWDNYGYDPRNPLIRPVAPTPVKDNTAVKQKIQAQIAGLQVTLSQHQTALVALGAPTDANAAKRSAIQAKITAVQNKIASLQAQLTALG